MGMLVAVQSVWLLLGAAAAAAAAANMNGHVAAATAAAPVAATGTCNATAAYCYVRASERERSVPMRVCPGVCSSAAPACLSACPSVSMHNR